MQFLVMQGDPFILPTSLIVSYGIDTPVHGELFPDLRIKADTPYTVWWTELSKVFSRACTGLMSNDTAMAQARVSDDLPSLKHNMAPNLYGF